MPLGSKLALAVRMTHRTLAEEAEQRAAAAARAVRESQMTLRAAYAVITDTFEVIAKTRHRIAVGRARDGQGRD